MMLQIKTFWLWIFAVCLLLASINSIAQDEEEAAEETGPRSIYIPLKPPFVVNYGGPGRLRYMKIEVSVRVTSSAGARAIRHHMPFIRNDLILLFSKQTEEVLDTQAGKEQLRQETVKAINNILEVEDGESDLADVYFNQLVLQK